MSKKNRAMSRWGRKAPTTDPACKDRYRHHNGQKCDTCGGVG